MSFQFATCNRRSALEFLRKLYPSYEISDTKDSAGDLLDFVGKDIIRITDPDFHTGQIVPSKNWDDKLTDDIEIALKKIVGDCYIKNDN